MKKIILLLLLLAGIQLSAQITINIKPSHTDFMKYDAVRLRVYLKNYSSMPITFGQNEKLRGELDFIIYHKGRKLLTRYSNKKTILSGIILKPGETRTLVINLANFYPLQQRGDYTVTATLKHPRFSKRYRSNETTFRVDDGTQYWTRTFGVPDYTGKRSFSEKIPTRTYSVKIFNNGVARIYFLVVEDDNKVYAVKRLGFDLGSEYRPELLVDATARFHAMLHVNPKVFIYYRYNFDGKLEKRQIYMRTTTKPLLVVHPTNGSVIVDGGRVAVKDVDYEEIKDLPFMDYIDGERPDTNAFGTFEDFRDEK
ncbi:MAG: hypothetical protein IJW23_09865 [Lentisphaeria bacterium]|nr:hypothetical protein [Lentisphaeria bacterium]